jgi:hypothetical protein
MTALTQRAHVTNQPAETAVKQPRFGGILWRFWPCPVEWWTLSDPS